MILSDDQVEIFLGILGIGGQVGCNVVQDRDPLDRLCGNRDQGAIGTEELFYLLGHNLRISLTQSSNPFVARSMYPQK